MCRCWCTNTVVNCKVRYIVYKLRIKTVMVTITEVAREAMNFKSSCDNQLYAPLFSGIIAGTSVQESVLTLAHASQVVHFNYLYTKTMKIPVSHF